MPRSICQEAYCRVERGEVFLFNCHISPYEQGGYANHEPLRKRKLLLNRREISKLDKAVAQKGYTIIPLACTSGTRLRSSRSASAEARSYTTSAPTSPRKNRAGACKKVMSERNV
jgi:hypothetical protein